MKNKQPPDLGHPMPWPAISRNIWDMKYRLKAPDGTPIDETIEGTWRRVARALAAPEQDSSTWEDEFYAAMVGFKFIPAGRIIAGAGTERRVTLFNCYVMGTIPDSMSGIFEHLREAALTMQQGGGIGYDFSTLRPRGAPVVQVGADASGPLSFMDVWDAMCRTVMSAGSRRGAMMATMRCDHPDIEAFIDAKRDPARLRNFNLSVLVTDGFMAAIEADAKWDLVFEGKVYRTISARDLWKRLMRATYEYAEPGVLFIDRINRENNLHYCETIASSNPCGEQILPPYGACLLGSINLAALVRRPFSQAAEIDPGELRDLVTTAVRMLDNVNDVSRFPLPRQVEEAKAKRRIGLGITGLADALIMCKVRYGSPLAVELLESWCGTIMTAAYNASRALAQEKGAFPAFNPALYDSGFMWRHNYLGAPLDRPPLRNSHLLSIAPTGTISLLANNVSSGLEPVFSLAPATRKVLLPDGTREEHVVEDYAYGLWRKMFGDDPLPDYFVDAQTLTPADHLVMQAAAQKYIDSSISKTINLPEDISFEDFQDVYRTAYESGCKGCTTYRPNDITGSVLSVAKPKETPAPAVPAETLAKRPDVLPGETYKLKWLVEDHAFYVTISDAIEGERRRPYEVFVNSKGAEHYAWIVGLTRMISAVFRRGGDVGFVAEELQAVFDPRGGQWMDGKFVPSLVAAIGVIIDRHMRAIGYLAGDAEPLAAAPKDVAIAPARGGKACPKCGAPGLIHAEGCESCPNCGWSKCA